MSIKIKVFSKTFFFKEKRVELPRKIIINDCAVVKLLLGNAYRYYFESKLQYLLELWVTNIHQSPGIMGSGLELGLTHPRLPKNSI